MNKTAYRTIGYAIKIAVVGTAMALAPIAINSCQNVVDSCVEKTYYWFLGNDYQRVPINGFSGKNIESKVEPSSGIDRLVENTE